MRGTWGDIPIGVGAIDGTSHQVYKPQTEAQELYYSGHRHQHCMHTQIIVDCNGNIVHVHSGFLGHTNDAQAFNLMEPIGPGQSLSFPPDLRILADQIYPSRYPLITGYKKDQLARKPRNIRHKYKRLNRIMNGRRVRVEHKIGCIKTYRVCSSLFRHPRKHMCQIVELLASLTQRKFERNEED